MKRVASLLLVLIALPAVATDLQVSKDIYSRVALVEHTAPGEFGSYLTMNVSFPPVSALFEDLDRKLDGTLNRKKARTEAHITVITPGEYDKVLKETIAIEQIHELAIEHNIQDAGFEILFLGRSSAKLNGKIEHTYYIVVRSEKLLQIRRAIFNLFREEGGNTSQFDPNLFYPHITIGFTKKDLHLGTHNVKKGLNSCYEALSIR